MMNAAELVRKSMARCGLSKNTVLDPFQTADQMVNEFVDALNSLVATLATDNNFSNLLKTCKFFTYGPWKSNVEMQAGQSVVAMYNGELTRFKALNQGQTETQPAGEGVFTMNLATPWTAGMSVTQNMRCLSDKKEWRALAGGTAGDVAPTFPTGTAGDVAPNQIQVSDGSITWVYVRDVLYWQNMGDPNFYPFDEICPDFAYLSQNTMIDITQNRTMTFINDQIWQTKVATNVTDGYAHFYTMARGGISLYPSYPAGDKISFKYYTENVVKDQDGNEKSQFTAAGDTCLFPDWLIIFGTAMRWRQSKKLNAVSEEADFNRQVERFIAQCQTGDAIHMDGIPSTDLRSVPVGGWEIGG